MSYINGLFLIKIYKNMAIFKKEKTINSSKSPEPKAIPNLVETMCLECGHSIAEYYIFQIRGSDQPATEFWKCINCRKITRSE